MRLLFILPLILCLSCATPPVTSVSSSDSVVKKLEAFEKSNDMVGLIKVLHAQQTPNKALLTWLRERAEGGHPLLQFELSRLLIETDPREALQWFAIGRVGATLDVIACTDATARPAIPSLVMIYQHAIDEIEGDQEKYIPYLKRALDWHKRHPVRPSPTWICIHGMGTASGQPVLISDDQWAEGKAQALRDMDSVVEKAKVLRESRKTRQPDGGLAAEAQRLYEREFEANSLAWSPDGKYLATTGILTKSVNIWDIEKRKVMRTLMSEMPGHVFDSLAYSPDGHLLAGCQNSKNVKARVWNPITGDIVKDIGSYGRGGCAAVAFSPNGKWFVVGYWRISPEDRERLIGIAFFDTQTWALIKDWKVQRLSVKRIAFSLDGKYLAVGGSEIKPALQGGIFPRGIIELWSLESDGPINNHLVHANSDVQSLAFSMDGKSIVSGTKAGSGGGMRNMQTSEWVVWENQTAINVWEIIANNMASIMDVDIKKAENADITTLRYTLDGKYLISGGTEVRIWDATTYRLLQTMTVPGLVSSVAVSPDSGMLAASVGKIIVIWKLKYTNAESEYSHP